MGAGRLCKLVLPTGRTMVLGMLLLPAHFSIRFIIHDVIKIQLVKKN